MTMAMRYSTAQVTTVNGKAHQATLLHISENMQYSLGDIQQLLQLLHKPTAYSKGFKRWLSRRLNMSMSILQASSTMQLRSNNAAMPLLAMLLHAVCHTSRDANNQGNWQVRQLEPRFWQVSKASGCCNQARERLLPCLVPLAHLVKRSRDLKSR